MTDHMLFVYGSLKRGYYNNTLLDDATYIEAARTIARDYHMVDVGFPMVSRMDEPGQRISGELWSVPDDVLPNIDSLEGHPHWYEREITELITDGGTYTTGWMYMIPRQEIWDAMTKAYIGQPCKVVNGDDFYWGD